jgi:hypothetical protein
MAAGDGDTIIIRSGSVEVEFDTGNFSVVSLPEPNPKKRKKHRNDSKIVQIVIKGPGVDFDSGEHPDGIDCEITVSYT